MIVHGDGRTLALQQRLGNAGIREHFPKPAIGPGHSRGIDADMLEADSRFALLSELLSEDCTRIQHRYGCRVWLDASRCADHD